MTAPHPHTLSTVITVARRVATLAALAVGVVGSVATSQSAPYRTDDATTGAFSLSTATVEHELDLELETRAALAHTLTIELQPADESGTPVAAVVEIDGLDDEPIVLSGSADAWPSASLDVPVACEGDVCTFRGTLRVRVHGTEPLDAARLVVVLASVMVDYDEASAAIDADVVRLDLVEPAPLSETP